jgi:hypothetical protein
MTSTSRLGSGPICLCRDRIPVEMLPELDEWTPKHFDDSLQHPAVVTASSFAVLNEGYNSGSDPNRLFVYTASDIAGLVDWIDSPELREAIADGADREAQVLGVDGEPFTGNIYEPDRPGQARRDGEAGRTWLAVERFEVPADLRGEFDAWLGARLARIAAGSAVRNALTWTQKRDVPRRFPYDRYVSAGNRMLTAEFAVAAGRAPDAALADIDAALEGIGGWRARLPYYRRDIAEHMTTRPDG